MITSLGSMQFDVYCHKAPKTAENFLELCSMKAYDGSPWHRLIPGFMVQGGQPVKAGQESYFGGPFEDECIDSEKRLGHSQRGMLSMANKGRDTNSC